MTQKLEDPLKNMGTIRYLVDVSNITPESKQRLLSFLTGVSRVIMERDRLMAEKINILDDVADMLSNEPLGYRTKEEHILTEKLMDRVVAKVRAMQRNIKAETIAA